jgi:hypothetical protein
MLAGKLALKIAAVFTGAVTASTSPSSQRAFSSTIALSLNIGQQPEYTIKIDFVWLDCSFGEKMQA